MCIRDSEATHHEIQTTINCFQLVLQLIIETTQIWFQAGLHSNLLILNVLGDHFWTFWNPGRPRWHQFGDHLVPGFTQEGSWASQCRFASIFDEFRMPDWDHFWGTFWYFMWVEVSKSMFGLQARFLMIFDCRNCWFLMPVTLKNIVNTVVFVRFRILAFLLISMIFRMLLDTFWSRFWYLGVAFCEYVQYWWILWIWMDSWTWGVEPRISSSSEVGGKKDGPWGLVQQNKQKAAR